MGKRLIINSIICFFLLSAVSVKAQELKRLTLDDASLLGTTIATDSENKYEGLGSVKITTQWPVVICLGEVSGIDIENTKLLYQAKVKCENLEGSAFLEMWCDVDGGQYFSRGMDSVVTNTMDWKSLETLFLLKPQQKATKVTLNIVINGKGTVWIDDIVLTKESLDDRL